MKCRKCNCHFDGKACPNCGTLAIVPDRRNATEFPAEDAHNPAEIPPSHKFRLLGFRSGKPWKMVLSILYLVFCFLLLIGVLVKPKFPGLPASDTLVQRCYDAVMLLIFISPYIFLSESKLRDHLPLFRKGKTGKSILGMVLIIAILFTASELLSDCFSPEYQAHEDHHQYEISETRNPTCTRKGKISHYCGICGDTEMEWFDKLGHDYSVEKTDKNGRTELFCSRCGDEE